jgi:hypothetical protein
MRKMKALTASLVLLLVLSVTARLAQAQRRGSGGDDRASGAERGGEDRGQFERDSGRFGDDGDDEQGGRTSRGVGTGRFGDDDDEPTAAKAQETDPVERGRTNRNSDDDADEPAPVNMRERSRTTRDVGAGRFGDDDNDGDEPVGRTNRGGGGTGRFGDDSDADRNRDVRSARSQETSSRSTSSHGVGTVKTGRGVVTAPPPSTLKVTIERVKVLECRTLCALQEQQQHSRTRTLMRTRILQPPAYSRSRIASPSGSPALHAANSAD